MMNELLKFGLIDKGGSIAGGMCTVVGLGGPIGRRPLAGDLVVVPVVAHWPAGALAIALAGNGAGSLDRLFGLAYPDWVFPARLVLVAAARPWHLLCARCRRRMRSLSGFERNS